MYGRIDVTMGVHAGKTYLLSAGDERTIGRLESNDIPFVEPSVSGKHLKLYASEDGFWVEDVGSRNGTLVNGERIESALLEEGDQIRFGRSELVFRMFETKEEAEGADALDSAVDPQPPAFKTQQIPSVEDIDGTIREDVGGKKPDPDDPEMNMLGRIALYNNMITELQLKLALEEMKENPGQRLGEILIAKGFLTDLDLDLVLRIQNGAKREAAGKERDDTRVQNLIEVAAKKGFLKAEQVKHAKLLQKKAIDQGFNVPLDEILLKKKYLSRQHYHEIMDQQGRKGLGVNIPGYDRYELLGYGGMGAVYKARQVSMDRPVAIKVLSERFRDKERYRERFLKEARNVAKLNHENIIAGYDFGESDNVSYFVMEFVEGPTCEELLQETGRLDEKQAAEIALQTSRALQHAHEKGMVHRDIKPENIMITNEDKKVKLCDLGLAWSVDEFDEGGKGFGTPNYMSPEQIRGQSLDIRTDIYSLGVSLFRMLFGKLPFYGKSPAVTMSMHLNEPVTFPDETMSPLQRSLANVIARMLAKNANERYQEPSVIVAELEGILERLMQPTPPAARPAVAPSQDEPAAQVRKTTGPRRRRRRRRRR